MSGSFAKPDARSAKSVREQISDRVAFQIATRSSENIATFARVICQQIGRSHEDFKHISKYQ